MAKDSIGNTLAEDDFVRIEPPKDCFGRIVKITHGGAIVGRTKVGGNDAEVMSPGVITVQIIMQTTFDPQNEIATHIVKVVDPKPEQDKKPHLLV